MGAINEAVDGLDKVFVKLVALLFLVRPVMGSGLGVLAMYLLVVQDEGLDGVRRQLVGHLVAQDHVDVNDVGLDMEELVTEHAVIWVLGHVGVGHLGEHEGGEGPYGAGGGQGLREASLVLGYAVEGSLDTVDALEGLGQPGVNLGAEDDIDGGGSWCEGSSRGRQELNRHRCETSLSRGTRREAAP